MSAPLFGILNVNKSRYVTSRAVVNQVHRLVKPAKAGHAGTLDPMATGVLLVGVGRATRLVDRMHGLEKVYRARFVFGSTSDTDDSMGQVQTTGATAPTAAQIEELLPRFRGEIMQVPPVFSAIHVGGKRAYKLAREGKQVELEARPVRVDRLELLGGADGEFDFEIECGSGTYIRSLARDLGEALGCGGLMSALERTRIGPFTVEDGIQTGGGEHPQAVLSREDVEQAIHSPLAALPGLRVHHCDAEQTRMTRLGRRIPVPADIEIEIEPGVEFEVAMISDAGKLIAISVVDATARQLRARLVFDSLQ